MKDKKSYYLNMVEAKDDKMCEVLNFNFGCHHDIAAMVEKTCESGIFKKDKHCKQFVLALHFLHHVIKKNPDLELFKEFAPQFEAFRMKVKGDMGCCCKE